MEYLALPVLQVGVVRSLAFRRSARPTLPPTGGTKNRGNAARCSALLRRLASLVCLKDGLSLSDEAVEDTLESLSN